MAMGSVQTATMAKNSKAENPVVPIRHMDFGFDSAPLKAHFYDDNAFASAFFMAFSAVIPQGERFFIESVRNYRKRITDPELEVRVTGFIGQEAMHGKEHDAVNEAYTRMGYPIGLLDKMTRNGLRTLAKRLPKSYQLSVTVALEHYTAIISEYVLGSEKVHGGFDKRVGNFVLWHMMEETEHKAVAFDVYEKVVGSYTLRVGTMIPTTVILIAALASMQARLMASDGSLKNPRLLLQHAKGFAAIYGPRGLFGRVAPHLLDYFKPGFHPNDHDTREILSSFREKFFGEEGELNTQLQKVVVPKVRTA
jgi:predicted metal-dependent hydrolase